MELHRASEDVGIECGKRLPFGQPVAAMLISRLGNTFITSVSCHHHLLSPLFLMYVFKCIFVLVWLSSMKKVAQVAMR